MCLQTQASYAYNRQAMLFYTNKNLITRYFCILIELINCFSLTGILKYEPSKIIT